MMIMKKTSNFIRTKRNRDEISETRSPEKDAIFSGEKQGRGKGGGRVCSAGGAEEGEMKRAPIFAGEEEPRRRVCSMNVCMYVS